MIERNWTILDETGGTAVNFTSLIDLDYRNDGNALTYPIEEGSFANYNKIQSPNEIRVTLGVQGLESDFEETLNRLDEYQKNAVKLSISTPAAFYDGYTLESYSYRRARDGGAGQLMVELTLVEVREVETRTTATVITRPKNPTSSDKTNTGKTQTENPNDSVISGIAGGKTSDEVNMGGS